MEHFHSFNMGCGASTSKSKVAPNNLNNIHEARNINDDFNDVADVEDSNTSHASGMGVGMGSPLVLGAGVGVAAAGVPLGLGSTLAAADAGGGRSAAAAASSSSSSTQPSSIMIPGGTMDAVRHAVTRTTSAAAHAAEIAVDGVVEAAGESRAELAAAAASTAGELMGHATEAASAAGHALLELGKTLPWVAPVAFLIGAVAKAAHDAKTLRADAQAFGRTVESVEDILKEAGDKGTLDKAKNAVDDLRGSLEEGLAYCQRLASQSTFTAMLLSSRDATKLQEINQAIQDSINVITLMASVTTATLVQAKFAQGERLKAKLEELGGAASALDNEDAMKELEGELEASDKLLMASVQKTNLAVEKSHKQLWQRLKTQNEESRAQSDAMSKQIEKLTTMMSAMMAFRAGGENATGESMAQQTTGAVLREIQECMPIRQDEARGIEQIRKLDLDIAGSSDGNVDISDLVDSDDLQKAVQDAAREFGAPMAFMSTFDQDTQTVLASAFDKEKLEGGVGGEYTSSMSGMRMPREMTGCQHVIARNEVVQAQGGMGKLDGVPSIGFEAVDALAAAGAEHYVSLKHRFDNLNLDDPDGTFDSFAGIQVKNKGIGDFVSFMSTVEESHYSAAPIRVNGAPIGTFCVLDGKHRNDIDGKKLQQMADRVSEILVRKRAENRQKASTNLLSIEEEGSHTSVQAHADVAQAAASRRMSGKTSESSRSGGAITHLTEDTFEASVMAADRDVVVMLTAPWCGVCKSLVPAFSTMAAKYKSPMFATYDVDASDVPLPHDAWRTNKIPTIVLAPRGVGVNPVRFGGHISSSDLTALEVWLAETHNVAFDPPLARSSGRAPENELVKYEGHDEPAEPSSLTLVNSVSPPATLEQALEKFVQSHAAELDVFSRVIRRVNGYAPSSLEVLGRVLDSQHSRTEALADENPSVAKSGMVLGAMKRTAEHHLNMVRHLADSGSAGDAASSSSLLSLAEAVAMRHGAVNTRVVQHAFQQHAASIASSNVPVPQLAGGDAM